MNKRQKALKISLKLARLIANCDNQKRRTHLAYRQVHLLIIATKR